MKRWRRGLTVFIAVLLGTHSVAATALAYDVSAESNIEDIIFEETTVSPAELFLEETLEDVVLEENSMLNMQESEDGSEELADLVTIDEILEIDSDNAELLQSEMISEAESDIMSDTEELQDETETLSEELQDETETLLEEIAEIQILEETELENFELEEQVVDIEYASEISGDFEFELLNGTYAYIVRYLGDDTEVTIPEQLGGYYIQEIGSSAFENYTELEKIILNSECTTIGNYAFAGCTSLEAVEFSTKTTEIRSNAFYGCTGLTSIELPDTITYIGYEAFRDCTGLTSFSYPKGIQECGGSILEGCTGITEITVPEGMSFIPDNMFSGCAELEIINLPESLQTIGDSAFNSCISLTEINLPANLQTIGSYAFEDATALTQISLPENLNSIGSYAFSNCDALTSIEYPENFASLGNRAFFDCDNLSYVNYPVYLVSCGSSVYERCPNLTSVTVPDGVVTLAANAFSYSNLTEVILPDSLTEIGDAAFEYCTGLTSVTIPPEVATIGANAFSGCSGSTELILNDKLTVIEERAFEDMTNLETISFPASVTSIGYEAFRDCSRLKNIVYPVGLTSCSSRVFAGCDMLKYVTVSEGVTAIPANMFSDCEALKRISLPSTLELIGSSAFSGCTSLVNLVIPDGITAIPDYAFEYCSSLEQIWIPASVESIGYNAFQECTALTIHGSEGSVAQTYAADNGFAFSAEAVTVDYVTVNGLVEDEDGIGLPDVTVMVYDTVRNELTELCTTDENGAWSCGEMQDSVTYKVGFFHAEYDLTPSELFITPTGDTWTAETVTGTRIFEGTESTASFTYEVIQGNEIRITGYEGTDTELVIPDVINGYIVREIGERVFEYKEQLTHVLLPTGLRNVGYAAFADCTQLVYVGFQEECTVIDGSAFRGCISLKDVYFPAGLINIRENAFQDCTSLQSAKLPDTVQSIGYRAFRGCTELSEFSYPLGLTSASGDMFADCPKLTSIRVPEGVTKLADYVFQNCTYLTEVYLPSTLMTIGTYAFSGTMLEEIELPDSLTTIQDNAFNNCDGLTAVSLPDGLTTLGYRAFRYCDNLESINYPAALVSSGGAVFEYCPKLTSITVPEGIIKLVNNAFSYSSLVSVELPSSLEEIGNYAFSNCIKIASFEVPVNVKKIGEYAFENCTGIKSLVLPEGLEQIGNHAFRYLTGIRSLEIPDTVISIGYRAFYNCTNLTSVNYPIGLSFSGGSVFGNCKKLEKIEIPEGITMIPDSALNGNSSLRTILLPSTLTEIGTYAFSDDSGLRKMILPDGITEIKQQTFYYCTGLEHVWIPESVTAIGYRAFYECPSLVIHGAEGSFAQTYAEQNGFEFSAETVEMNFVNLSGSVKDGNDQGLSGVSVLVYNMTRNEQTGIYTTDENGTWNCLETEKGEAYRIRYHHPQYQFTPQEQEILPMEDTYTVDPVIGTSIFEGADYTGSFIYEVIEGNDIRITGYTGEDTVLVMPSEIDGYTVREIGSQVFYNNTTLTHVLLPEYLNTVESQAFYNCTMLEYVGFFDECTKINTSAFMNCISLEEVAFPVSLLTIEQQAFQGCTSLKSVDLPDSVQSIGYRAFRNCSSLSEFGYPLGLTSASSDIFAGCTMLTSVTVPEGVTVLANSVFENCQTLKEIILPSTLQTIGTYAFASTTITSIELPLGLQQIKEHAFYNCDGLTEITFPEGMSYLGYRAFRSCDNLKSINYPANLTHAGGSVFQDCVKLISVVVPEGVTALKGNVFSYSKIQQVTLPSTLESIGESAFESCEALTELVIPETVTSIGAYAFYKCSALTELTIPGSVSRINNYMLHSCTGLTSLTLGEGITEIGYQSLGNLDGLTELILPDTITKIETEALLHCDNLAYVNYPESLNSCGGGIFSNCKKLLRIEVPDTVTAIPVSAFEGCTFLREVRLGSGVTSIRSNAFSGCTGISQMILPDGLTEIEYRAFRNCTSMWKTEIPASVENIHDTAFEGTDSILFVVENSYAHLYAIHMGFQYEILPNENINYDEYVLDMSESSYYTKSDTVQCSSLTPLNLKYQIKEEEYAGVSNLQLGIVLAQNLQLYEQSVLLNGSEAGEYTYENEILTVPVTEQSGTLNVYVKPMQQGNVTTYAYLSYKKNDVQCQDLIGVIDLKIPVLTLDTDSVLGGDSVFVQGVTTGKEAVCFTVNGEAAGKIIARKDGQYSTRLALPELGNGAAVTLRAYLESDPDIYVERTCVYQGEGAVLVEFMMYYNAHSEQSLDLLRTNGRTSVSLFPGHPFTFRIRFENGENIDEVYVVSTKNGVTKTLKAEATAVPGLFIAYGYFDPENPSYVPGNISLSYKFQSEIENITTDLVPEEIVADRPECWDTAEAEEVVTKKEENKVTESTTVSMADEYGTQLEVTKTSITHKNVNVPQYLAQNGYQIVTDDIGNRAAVKVQYNGTSVTESYINLERPDIGGDFAESFVEEVVHIKIIKGPEDFDKILFKDMPVIEGIGYVFEYKAMVDQVNSANMTEAERAAAKEQLETIRDYYSAKLVVSYISAVVPIMFGLTFPASLAVTAIALLVEAEISSYYEAKLNGQNYFLLMWLIDPSGYVYEAVLPNRIKGAKLTIYYKESEDGTPIVWDAEEYSQQNPLYSDSEGYYAWDVPEGWWQVVCELDGYQTWTSEWMTVPPIRTDVNIGLISQKSPEVSGLEVHEDGVIAIFDKYILPETADDMILLNEQGENIAYELKYRTDETSPEGIVYAKRFELLPSESTALTDGEIYTVIIPKTVLSYAGVSAEALSITEICVPDITFAVPENLTVKYGERITVPVKAEPADAEIVLTADVSSKDFLKVISVEKSETEGTWNVVVEGRLPGLAYINFGAKGLEYSLEAAVTIEMNNEFAGFEGDEDDEDKETEVPEDPEEPFVPVELTECVVQPVADMTWTGKPITPELTVAYGDAVLKAGADYEVKFSDNINAGTATAVLTGIGNYSGELVVTFQILEPKCSHAYQKVTVSATCEKNGREYEICKLCQEIKLGSEKTLSAFNHSYGDYTVTKEATALKAGEEVRTCKNCGKKESRPVVKLKPTVSVNADDLPLKIKQSTKALKVTGLAKGDYVETWISSDTAVFTVTGKADGTCVIKAGKKPKKSAVLTIKLASGLEEIVKVTTQKAAVTTKKITGLSSKLTISKDDKYTLAPVLTPITSSQKFSYTSSNKKVAAVSKSGVITAKKAGKATITVKSGSKKVKVKVTVPKTVTEAITGVPASLTLKKGKSYTLKAKIMPKNSDYNLTYKTSSKKVAVVSTKGKITAKKKGTAVITVKSGSVSFKCKVTVK